VVIKDLTN